MPRAGRNPRENVVDLEPQEANDDIVVNLRDYAPPPRFRLQGDEAIEDTAPFQPEPAEGAGYDHNENLANSLPEDVLQALGQETIELVEQDIADRQPWRDRFERGMEMLGLVESDIDDGPFPGASNVVHPLILEAVQEFWGRAYAEFMPPEGPVKAKLQGAAKSSQQMIDRADRVVEFMNYDCMTGDAGYATEKSRLFWALPIQGSAATKTFKDPVTGQVTGIYVPAEDLILQATSSDLRSVPRFTHRMRKTMNEVRQLQLVGHYRNIPLDPPAQEDQDPAQAVKDEIGDQKRSSANDEDNRLTIYETFREIDLEGHEHTDDKGQPTGWGLPYYITVDKDSEQVLSIRRGWKEGDETYRRRLYFRKYDFVPGPGAYGLGFFHLMGGLQAAATGALRVMLDSAASASLSGGFVSKNARLKGERLISEPGVWVPVDASGSDLKQAFFPLPVKEPSNALYNMLQFVTDLGRKFSATTSLQTGDADGKNTPVGTTMAILEQGQKVMSTIHKLIHAEFARELKDRYDLYSEDIPEKGYPYEIGGDERAVYADDFAPGFEVVPVSDPNIFSNVQRLQMAQAIWAEAKENPDVFDKKEAGRRFLAALKAPDPEGLIKPDAEALPYDSVGEIQAIVLGKPVKVLPEQDHVSHLKALWAFASNPEYAGNPQVMEQIAPHLMTVTAQHVAYAWAANARQQGVPAGFMDPESGQMSPPEVPPEQITQMMAMIAPSMVQVPGLPGVEQEGDKGGAELEAAKVEGERAKLELKREEHDMKMQQEQQKMAWEQEKEQLKLELEQQKAQVKIMTEQMKAQAQQQAVQQKSAIDAQMAEQQMAHDQQNMQRQAQMDEQRMQQESSMMQREGQMKEAQMGQEMQHAERKSRLDELRRPAGGGQQGGPQQ